MVNAKLFSNRLQHKNSENKTASAGLAVLYFVFKTSLVWFYLIFS